MVAGSAWLALGAVAHRTSAANLPLGAAGYLAGLFTAFRSPFVGLYVSDKALVCVGYLRSWRVHPSEITSYGVRVPPWLFGFAGDPQFFFATRDGRVDFNALKGPVTSNRQYDFAPVLAVVGEHAPLAQQVLPEGFMQPDQRTSRARRG